MKNKACPTGRHQSFGRGFTIVESLVAITILVLAVTGATSAIQTSISSYVFSKNQVIAFYLAQEGFEQIRNLRDENRLNDRPWLTGIADAGDPCEFGKYCAADPVPLVLGSPFLLKCGDNPKTCPVLRQDPTTGFFGYNLSWPETVFEREIVLTQVSADEISVLVTIYWSKGLVDRQFEVRESILNWR